MHGEPLEIYIQKKLAELDKQKDMQDVIYKGKLSFGIDSTTYAHLPSWQNLVKQKKQMVKMVWTNAFFVALTTVAVVGNFFTKFEQNWIKALLGLVLLSGMITLFYVIGSFYSLFYQFRQTEREVRKLIYQDILFQLKKVEKESA